jgi:hypothetical protein
MSITDLTKTWRWTLVLAKAKQFLLLKRHPPHFIVAIVWYLVVQALNLFISVRCDVYTIPCVYQWVVGHYIVIYHAYYGVWLSGEEHYIIKTTATISTMLSKQFQNLIEKSWKHEKSILIAYIHMTAHFPGLTKYLYLWNGKQTNITKLEQFQNPIFWIRGKYSIR